MTISVGPFGLDIPQELPRDLVDQILTASEDPDSYQKLAHTTAVMTFDKIPVKKLEMNHMYLSLKLCGEVGEIAEKIGKLVRDKDGVVTEEDRIALVKELGDVAWYVAMLATTIGASLSTVLAMNLLKLFSRKNRGKIGGSGDNR